jgi:hypothetical protein
MRKEVFTLGQKKTSKFWFQNEKTKIVKNNKCIQQIQ